MHEELKNKKKGHSFSILDATMPPNKFQEVEKGTRKIVRLISKKYSSAREF
jgi:hypothetical protein